MKNAGENGWLEEQGEGGRLAEADRKGQINGKEAEKFIDEKILERER